MDIFFISSREGKPVSVTPTSVSGNQGVRGLVEASFFCRSSGKSSSNIEGSGSERVWGCGLGVLGVWGFGAGVFCFAGG